MEGPTPQAVNFLTTETTAPTGITGTNHTQRPGLHQLITVSKFSTLSKLLSVTVYVLRFVHNLRKPSKKTRALTPPKLHNARNEWIKNCQQVTYHKEISSMLSKSSPCKTLVRQLRLFFDNTGLLSCGGRIHNAPVSVSAKFPHLLLPKDPFTELVICDTHIRQLHAGVNSTLTVLRLWYWIPSGPQHVKKAISRCVTCKITGLPYDLPDPPHFQNQDYNNQSHLQSQALTSQEHYTFVTLEFKAKFTFVSSPVPEQEQSISKSLQIYQCRPSSLHIHDLQLGNLFLSK